MTNKKPSAKTLKALTILRDFGPIRPREFARKMWPDSDGWNRTINCGPNGAHRGGGMYLAGGSYLGKLTYKGYAERCGKYLENYRLTAKGREHLEQASGN